MVRLVCTVVFSRAARKPGEHDISRNVSLPVRVRTGAFFGPAAKPSSRFADPTTLWMGWFKPPDNPLARGVVMAVVEFDVQ